MLLLISADQVGNNILGHPRYLGTLLRDARRRLKTLGDARRRLATKGNPHEKTKDGFGLFHSTINVSATEPQKVLLFRSMA